MSVDGKISTGLSDKRDFDKDLPTIRAAARGLKQYYNLEQETDLFSLNTGKVMAKVGWNEQKPTIERLPVSFVIVDNKPHLTKVGVSNLLRRADKLYIVTTNANHPATEMNDKRLEVLLFDGGIDFGELLRKLKEKGADSLTIQSGGEMNSVLLRAGLIDELSIVIAPLAVGGRSTPTLIDGSSIQSKRDLGQIRPLQFVSMDTLSDSYLHLKYRVIN